MRKIGVLTSGGDAPGMNAAIRAVVRCGIEAGFQVYGIKRGYEGLIDGEIEELHRGSVGDIMQRGGTILKTARSKRFMEEDGFNRAVAMAEAFSLDAVVVIGGDGSMHGAGALSEAGIQTVCLPGTIDNDLGYTDWTIGFDTAVNTVLEAITKVRDTSSSHERTTIIEVMGRSCGDIGLYAGLSGGAERVLVPELPVDIKEICKKIAMDSSKGKAHSLIIVCEGAAVKSADLAEEVTRVTGREARLVVLSYLQRGGSPTFKDRILATECGAKAIDILKINESESFAVGQLCEKIEAIPLKTAMSMKREFDEEKLELIDILSK